jgi:hypothetical protein
VEVAFGGGTKGYCVSYGLKKNMGASVLFYFFRCSIILFFEVSGSYWRAQTVEFVPQPY